MNVWLRFLSGSRQGETIPFPLPVGGTIALGAAEDNHVMLPPPVESHHAVLRNEKGALLIQSLGRTRNGGVYRRQQKIERAPVLSGDQFELGRGGPLVEVLFQIEAPAPPPVRGPLNPIGHSPQQPDVQVTAQRPAPDFQMTAPRPAAPDFQGTAPSMPAVRPTAPVRAAASPVGPAAAGCPMCGAALGSDSFICYQCRRTLCTSHYDAQLGVCGQCAAAGNATAPQRAAFAPQFTAPSFPGVARTQELPSVPSDPTIPVTKPRKRK